MHGIWTLTDGEGAHYLYYSHVMLSFPTQTLNIVPEEEFPAFIAAMQSELPSTFRITGTRR